MGFHHVPHMEDWPVMSTMWKGITLMPFNFFSHNPAMTIPSPPSRSSGGDRCPAGRGELQ